MNSQQPYQLNPLGLQLLTLATLLCHAETGTLVQGAEY